MPTDILCSQLDEHHHLHHLNHLHHLHHHQYRPQHPLTQQQSNDASSSLAAEETTTTAAKSTGVSSNSGGSSLKNTRSASLPLKILLNDGSGSGSGSGSGAGCGGNKCRFIPTNVVDLNEKLIRSWNGMDTFLLNQLNKSSSKPNGTNFILYARFSLSEHFLNLIGRDQSEPQSLLDRRHRDEREESLSLKEDSNSQSPMPSVTTTSTAQTSTNSTTTAQDYYHDDIDEDDEDDYTEEMSSGSSPLASGSNTTLGEVDDDHVQFELDTDETVFVADMSPSPLYHNDSMSTLVPTPTTLIEAETETHSDINNNVNKEANDDVNFTSTAESNNENDQNTKSEEASNSLSHANNDLDQTITEDSNSNSSISIENSSSSIENSFKNLDLNSDQKEIESSPSSDDKLISHPTLSSSPRSSSHDMIGAVVPATTGSFSLEETLLEDSAMSSSLSTSTIDETGYVSTSSNEISDNAIADTTAAIPTIAMNAAATTSSTSCEATLTTTTNNASNDVSSSSSSSSPPSRSTSANSADDGLDDDIFKTFMPKKSCLKKNDSNRQQLFIDTYTSSSTSCGGENSTSTPLVPATPTSPSLSYSTDSASSPLFSSSSSSFQSPPSSSASSGQNEMSRSKKRVSFADVYGKELFTIRTMSEPSNCPPKLTSKIVQFFLNREFNQQHQQLKSPCYDRDYMYGQSSSSSSNGGDSRCNEFFSKALTGGRSYGCYGISTSNYTNDLNKLAGSIAVYSLNFAQPSADYFKFRQRIVDNFVSLENVMLNRFQINGTIKVKNIAFRKNVFVRCSFDKWTSYQDFQANYVPSEYYSSMMSHSSQYHSHHNHHQNILSSPTSHSISATFYAGGAMAHHHSMSSSHKEFDTFRFEFELPQSPSSASSSSASASPNSPNASIQFCICFRAGDAGNEYWDNNDGKNYEILQYVIDIESLKPQAKSNINDYASKSRNFKYEGANSRATSNLLTTTDDIYY